MPLDDRLRDELGRDADPVAPDTERHLAVVRGRGRARPSTTGWLLAATATIAVIAILVLGTLPGARVIGPGGTNAPTPSPGSAPPRGLEGTEWTVTLLATDPSVAELGMAGEWTLRVGATSTLDVDTPASFRTPSGSMPAGYVWALDGGSFVTNLFARDFGAACAGSGGYEATVEDTQLVFAGRDTCRPRHVLLTTRPWARGR